MSSLKRRRDGQGRPFTIYHLPVELVATDMEIACPDRSCGGRFRITRTGTTTFRHSEVTVVLLQEE